VACVYALLGQVEQAIDCLEKAVQHGFGHKGWLENDSDLNSVRSHPRFQALLARL
jgi:adenylate cyclase